LEEFDFAAQTIVSWLAVKFLHARQGAAFGLNHEMSLIILKPSS
jgi:hypothetical protein